LVAKHSRGRRVGGHRHQAACEAFIPNDPIHGALQGFNTIRPVGDVVTLQGVARAVAFLRSGQCARATAAIWDVDAGVPPGRNAY
jgi:hypothetical protein